MTRPPFDHARAAFLAAGRTLRNERRDFPEWHLGRPRYALWALDVDLPAVRDAVAGAASRLADVLLDGYRRQPHVTLALCGFPAAAPRHADDFGPAQLAAQLDALQASGLDAIELEIAAPGSFTSAPFLAVHDPAGHIGRVRRALAGDRDEPGGPYTPHVTVGLYAGEWPTAPLQQRLEAHPSPALRLRLTRLSLQSYAAPVIGGPLASEGEFDLQRGRFVWHRRPAGWPDGF